MYARVSVQCNWIISTICDFAKKPRLPSETTGGTRKNKTGSDRDPSILITSQDVYGGNIVIDQDQECQTKRQPDTLVASALD